MAYFNNKLFIQKPQSPLHHAMLREAGPENAYLSRKFGDTSKLVVPPSHVGHPSHPFHPSKMPSQYDPRAAHQAPPGPIAVVYKVVRDQSGQIGWAISDDLVVTEVVPGGAAARAGIQRGMRIKSVNSVAVSTIVGMKALVGDVDVLVVAVDLPTTPYDENGGLGGTRPTGQTVFITGISFPPEMRVLNNKRGRMVRQYANIGVVDVPGFGEHDIPLINLTFEGPEVAGGGSRDGLHGSTSGYLSDVEQLSAGLPPGVKMIRVRKQRGQPLGLRLQNMVLDGVERESPAETSGADLFMGWRLTQVNGNPVFQTGDVKAHAGDGDEVMLVFEAQEVTIRKHPGEKLGAELLGLKIGRITPNSPADRSGLSEYTGYKITHVNGHPVSVLSDIAVIIEGSDSVRLRLHVDEASVELDGEEQLGMRLDPNMTLKGTNKGSPSKRQGVGAFVGKRLTHVNDLPVTNVSDVHERMKYPREDGFVSLRFDVSDHRPRSNSPARGGSVQPQPAYQQPSVPLRYPPYSDPASGYAFNTLSVPAGASRNVLQVPPDSSVFNTANTYVPPLPPPLSGQLSYNRITPHGAFLVSPNSYRSVSPQKVAPPVEYAYQSVPVPVLHSAPPAPVRVHSPSPEYEYEPHYNQTIIKPWDVYRAESLLTAQRKDQENKAAEVQSARIEHLEKRVRELQREKTADSYLPAWLQQRDHGQGPGYGLRQAPWEGSPPTSPVGGRGGGGGVGGVGGRAVSPQRGSAKACSTCGGLPEVECKDCALRYCRTCCAAAHSGSDRLRSTHINIVALPSPFSNYGSRAPQLL